MDVHTVSPLDSLKLPLSGETLWTASESRLVPFAYLIYCEQTFKYGTLNRGLYPKICPTNQLINNNRLII